MAQALRHSAGGKSEDKQHQAMGKTDLHVNPHNARLAYWAGPLPQTLNPGTV